MATYYEIDPGKSRLICAYRKNNTNYSFDGVFASHPGLNALVSGRPYVQRASGAPTRDDEVLLQNVYVSSLVADPPLTSSSVEVLADWCEKFPNKGFRKRRAEGEIVLSPYNRGRITARYEEKIDVSIIPPGNSFFPSGWWNPQWYPKWPYLEVMKILGAESMWNVSVAISYRPKTVTSSSAVARSPRIPIQDWKVPFSIEGSLVTSALAESKAAAFDVLTELAELPELVSYLGGKALDAMKAAKTRAKRLKAVSKLPLAKQVDAIASIELQFRYAIMPIYYSCQSIRKALSSYGTLYRESRDRKEEHFGDPAASPWFIEGNGVAVHRAFIKTAYDPASVIDQLTLILSPNPAVTAWELTTASFIIDWFINVGDFIAALTSPDVSRQMAACASTRFSGQYKYAFASTGAPVTTLQFETYVRKSINPQDHTGLYFEPYLDWKRWLDAFALSWSNVRSRS